MSAPSPLASDPASRLARARLALDGLSVGDAFGERFFGDPERVEKALDARRVPRAPWRWTDDTAMGTSVAETLAQHARIDSDALAARFARRWRAEPLRGYGAGAARLLEAVSLGADWRAGAAAMFGGQGSMGNGGAMRAAPVGGYFADDLERVADEARASAIPTHMHPEGQAGAVAVAVAAALAAQIGAGLRPRDGDAFLAECHARTPEGPTRRGIAEARTIHFGCSGPTAASWLGSGERVVSEDTVPFSLWCAARHLDDYEAALWTTVSGLGDRDTTCAIVGGIVVLSAAASIPPAWLAAREALPAPL